VKIPTEGIHVKQLGQPAREILHIPLARKSEDQDSREAWTKYFAKQQEFFFGEPLTVDLTLALGTDPPRDVSPRPKFYVASKGWLLLVVVIGLGAFFGAYYWLIQNKTALRDPETKTYSLGRSQMAFWGLLVFLCFVGVWLVTGQMEYISEKT